MPSRHVLPEASPASPNKVLPPALSNSSKAIPTKPGAKLLEQTYHYMLMQHAVDPDQPRTRMGGKRHRQPVSCARPHPAIHRNAGMRLPESGNVRQPSASRSFRPVCHRRRTAAMCTSSIRCKRISCWTKATVSPHGSRLYTLYRDSPTGPLPVQGDRVACQPHEQRRLHLWQYSDEDIDRLKNPAIKALFVTNPSNPPSYTLSPETMARIVNIVKEDNPNLMIITDDVYGTSAAFPLVHGRNSVQYALRVLFLQVFRRYRLAQCRHSAARIQCIRQTNIPIAERETRSPQPPLCQR